MSLNPFSLDIMTSPLHPIYQGCDNYDYSGTHMGDRKVVVTLQSPTAIDFMIGDYITYNGEKFTLQTEPITTRIHSSLMLAYTLTFWWNGYELQLANFLDVLPSGDDSSVYFNKTSEVILNDTIPIICGRIIANLDRSGYAGWTFSIHGSVDVAIKKDIEAINVQCYDVLQNMASVFGVEYRFDNATKTIWVGYPAEVTTLFEYGKDKGICEINRVQNDQKVITRVRAYGSNRNIRPDYRHVPATLEYHARLILPEDQSPLPIPNQRYSIIGGYLVDTIQEAAYGIREGVPYINEDIYPTIEGLTNTVFAVGSITDRPLVSTPQYNTIVITPAWSEWVTPDWKGFPYAMPTPIEIIHPAVTKEVLVETVPQGSYDSATFFVADLGFDLNDESIDTGSDPKIAFTTGNLVDAGELVITSFTKYMTIVNGQPSWDDGTLAHNKLWKITIARNSDDPNHIKPSAAVPIQVGDKYVFLNIFLPASYEDAAEARLLTSAIAYLQANTKSPEGYAIRLAEEYFTKFPLTLGKFKEGNAVTIRDTVLGLTERAVLIQSMSVSYKDNALLPTYNLTISDVPIKGSLDALRAGLKESNQTISSRINTVETNTNTALKSATILSSRILDNNLDIRGGIIAAQSIEPISQSVELKSAHYILQALFKVNYEGAINAALGTEGVLIHKEQDIVWDNTYDLAHQTWTIATPQNFSLLDGVMYYVYVKGSLLNGSAVWVVSETKIDATSEQNYYYFDWGSILAPIEGSRYTQTSYGSTYVTHLPATIDPASAAIASIDPHQVITMSKSPTFDSVKFNLTPAITTASGELSWNVEARTLSLQLEDGGSFELGEEIGDFYHNLSGVTLVNGDIVSVIGATGNRSAITLTDPTNRLLAFGSIGMVTDATINNNAVGRITKLGKVHELNTSAYAEGTVIYASATNPGKWTSVQPAAPNYAVLVGAVVVSHATQGVIALKMLTLPKLTDLCDVSALIALNTTGQFPVWNQTNQDFDFSHNISEFAKTPSTVSSDSINEMTAISHTHELGNVALNSVIQGTPVEYGALYNWYAATDARNIANTGWHVPSVTEFNTLVSYLGGTIVAGGKLKETGEQHWSGNIDATNESKFNGRGSSDRDNNGAWGAIKTTNLIWSSTSYNTIYASYLITRAINGQADIQSYYKLEGMSIRLAKDSTILTNGQTGTYTGNDGKVYSTICIGTQEWLSCNLNETKYRDGSYVHGFENGIYAPITNINWAALTTEGMCYYSDNEAYGGGETPLSSIITQTQHNSLQGLQGGTTAERYHLTAAERLKVQTIGIEDIAFEFADVVAGTAKDYTLDISASFGYTIESACLETNNGTLTGVAVKIGATAVTSLSSLTVDTAVDETASTGAKTVVIGNRVWLSVAATYTGTPTLIRGKLKIVRT